MIKHYLKSTINALWARKWISLLTLISIALSLVVVICMASFWNMLTAPMKPEVNKDRTFYLHKEYFKKENGKQINFYQAQGIVPNEFYTSTIPKLESVDRYTIFAGNSMDDFLDNGSVRMCYYRETDANFFKVFEFEFIDGKPYTNEMINNDDLVCVINEEIADHFFGTPFCVGKTIKRRHTSLHIAGVVKQPSHLTPVQTEIYIAANNKRLSYNWQEFEVAFLTPSPEDQQQLGKQLDKVARYYSDKNKMIEVKMYAKSSIDKIIADRYGTTNKKRSIVLVLLILILPVLSLIELLKSGIAIRLGETGLRKAFGATNKVICRQLILENVLITIMGGILGIFFAIFFFRLIHAKQSSALVNDFFHWKAIIYYLLTFIVMGILAGVMPSIKLARINLIDALQNKPQSLQLKSKLHQLLRGKIVTGTITVIAFFILTLSFNVIYSGLKMSYYKNIPVNTSDIINIKITYKSNSIEWLFSEKSGKKVRNLNVIQNKIKRELQQIKGVEESSFSERPIASRTGRCTMINYKEEGVLCGYNFWKVFDLQFEEGRWFQPNDLKEVYLPVVITRKHATDLGIEHLTAKTYFQFKSNEYDTKFKVVGIIKDIGKTQIDNHHLFFAPIEVPITCNVYEDFRQVKIKDGADIDRVKADIKKLFASDKWDKKGYNYLVETVDKIRLQIFIEHLKYHSIQYGIIGMILCFILIILFGSSWRQVNAQYLELGIRRSVGASRARIIRKIIFEKLIFYLAVMAVAVLIYLNFYKDLQIDYKIIAPAVSAALLFVVIMLATLLPAIKASRIQPVYALAEE